ncbi:hypothetical protein [Flavobacterium humi]|uniref:Uncharacterized protein n=1 Tax=Flavobacterium humi TaxID=2562683 RepID=A0A4Z0LDD0_9FLAO|nr:hypothetical protein [Flavobacterium humi]TGD59898.1 hypothetical protein E4635_02910 [Flavobacterium humi]
MPFKSIATIIDRTYRCDNYFEDFHTEGQPIVNQIEEWAKTNSITLNNGWKVEVAKSIQNRYDKIFETIDETLESKWETMFNKLAN